MRSDRAIEVNIAIMRAFVQLREMLASNVELARKLKQMEKKYDERFKIVFEAIQQFTPLEDMKICTIPNVLRSEKDSRLYTGSTNDLRRRLNEHNHGKVSSTKHRDPFKLIYYEACLNDQDARAREKYLKTGMGKRYLKNRIKRFLSSNGVNGSARKTQETDLPR